MTADSINIALPIAGVAVWVAGSYLAFARALWRIDRRLVRIETKLNIEPAE